MRIEDKERKKEKEREAERQRDRDRDKERGRERWGDKERWRQSQHISCGCMLDPISSSAMGYFVLITNEEK